MLERGAGNVEVATTDIIHGIIVNKERAVGVLNGAMGRENRVVGFDHGGGDEGGRIDREFELRFLAIVGAQALEQERAESRTGSTTEGMEDEETLKAGAVVLFTAHSLAWPSSSLSTGAEKIEINTPRHV